MVNHDWHGIWLCPIGIVAVSIVFFCLFFKDNTAVGHEAPAEEPKADSQGAPTHA